MLDARVVDGEFSLSFLVLLARKNGGEVGWEARVRVGGGSRLGARARVGVAPRLKEGGVDFGGG